MENILNNKPLAIILPFYGLLDLTKAMVASIATSYPYKILLIDNIPTTESKEWLLEITKNEDIEALQFPENLGCAASWNLGIKHAQKVWGSEVFFFPNNDILVNSGTIDTLIAELENPECALITATDICKKVAYPEAIQDYPAPKNKEISEAPEFSCFMLKMSTIVAIGYFDAQFYPAYFEDNDYHQRLKVACMHAYKTNQASYYHYGSRTMKQNEDIKALVNAGYAINRDYYISKWGGIPGEETTVIH